MDRESRLNALIDGAEELLTNLTDAHNPGIQQLRDQVDDAIADARRAIAYGGDDGSDRLRDIAGALDGYVRDYPWLAITAGVFVAGTIGFIAGTTLAAKKRSMRH